jgi:16S rRNA (guanine527-N7)-methyltransferase
MKNKFTSALEKEKIFLSDVQIEQFFTFSTLLKEWNKKINLTALIDDEDIIYKHFLDSLLCLKTNLSWHGNVIDVGTGAGFPGIPLKIFLGEKINLFLFDSLKKRVNFLDIVIKELGLTNIHCIHGRAEEFAKKNSYREQFDIVLARAVARLPILLELCLPFTKIGGHFLAMKGPDGFLELDESVFALEELGGTFKDKSEFHLKGPDLQRVIISIEKTKETPQKYPRKAGVLQKKPLIKFIG